MQKNGRLAIVGLWVCMLIFFLIGTIQMEADFRLEWLFPSDSYATQFQEWAKKDFDPGTRVTFYVQNPETLSEKEMYSCLQGIDTFCKNGGDGYLNTANVARDSWVTGVSDWDKGNDTVTIDSDGSGFYGAVAAWPSAFSEAGGANNDGGSFRWKTSAADPSSGFTKVRMAHGIQVKEEKLDGGGLERFETLKGLRKGVKSACSSAIPWNRTFLWWEETGYILPEFLMNIIGCCVVIFLLLLWLMPSWRVNGPCILSVLASIFGVLGITHWWGEKINGTLSVYTVICVGLSVDYVAHIGHAFGAKVGSADEKLLAAMTRLGPSVTHALLSTLAAALLLAPVETFFFRILFKCLFTVVVLGFVHGLAVAPALLHMFAKKD